MNVVLAAPAVLALAGACMCFANAMTPGHPNRPLSLQAGYILAAIGAACLWGFLDFPGLPSDRPALAFGRAGASSDSRNEQAPKR